jgi:hypothetical protein
MAVEASTAIGSGQDSSAACSSSASPAAAELAVTHRPNHADAPTDTNPSISVAGTVCPQPYLRKASGVMRERGTGFSRSGLVLAAQSEVTLTRIEAAEVAQGFTTDTNTSYFSIVDSSGVPT